MDDSAGLARTVTFSIAGYPLYLARTLIQLGYEPTLPDAGGNLPNVFSYITILKEQRGYTSLYTGLRFYLPAAIIKKSAYDLIASVVNHKRETDNCDASEIIAVCMRESALKIQTTLLTYPLVTLGIGYISASFFGADETIEYTLESLYRGVIPKLIIEVTMVWVTIISRRLTASLIQDELGQSIISKVPPFIVGSILYPFNVVSTVMADNGISRVNPKFDDWKKCYHHLNSINQLKRGSSFFYRHHYQSLDRGKYSLKRYF